MSDGNGKAVAAPVAHAVRNKVVVHPATATDGVKWGPLGLDVYKRSYSRTKPDGTNETWRDTIERVIDGNLALVDAKFHEHGEREKLFDLFFSMKSIPAGRHIWSTGVHGRQFLANCHSAGHSRKDLTEHFRFTFDELMKGGGVGSNYSNVYVNIYPPVFSKVNLHIVCNLSHPDVDLFKDLLSTDYNHLSHERHVVDDSREGWCEALAEVLRVAWDGRDHPLVIDVSSLRPKGAVLRSFGGKSSGPEPLVKMLRTVSDIMSASVGKKLSSIDIMQIDHEISKVVVAGGVRRSARMSIKHWADRDIFAFIKCKSAGQKFWSTNISVEVDEAFFRALRKNDRHANKVLRDASAAMYKNGEPGFWNSSLAAVGEVDHPFTPNPCGEISMPMWDVCNLGHVNLEQFHNDDNGAREAFRLMTRFLIRATFGDILNPHQREVVARNRRIGVGFFGYADWLAYQGVRFSESHHHDDIRSKLRSFREACKAEAIRYACQLRIPVPIKTTAIAPTGTISNLPGVTSGCQPIFARYFIRRVRYADTDENLKGFDEKEIEVSVNEPNTKIVRFYCKDPLVDRCERRGIDPTIVEEQSEISISDHLAVQSMLQKEFADNAISYTIGVDSKKVRAKDVEQTLRVHLPHLKGTTLMPEASREQMPFERIEKLQYEEKEFEGKATVTDAQRECLNGVCGLSKKDS